MYDVLLNHVLEKTSAEVAIIRDDDLFYILPESYSCAKDLHLHLQNLEVPLAYNLESLETAHGYVRVATIQPPFVAIPQVRIPSPQPSTSTAHTLPPTQPSMSVDPTVSQDPDDALGVVTPHASMEDNSELSVTMQQKPERQTSGPLLANYLQEKYGHTSGLSFKYSEIKSPRSNTWECKAYYNGKLCAVTTSHSQLDAKRLASAEVLKTLDEDYYDAHHN